jgi:hypothetical protein
MVKFLLGLLLLVSFVSAIGTRGVVTGPQSPVVAQGVAQAAGWYDWKLVTMSGQGDDLVIATAYGANMAMVGVINISGSAAFIVIKTVNTPGSTIRIPLAAGEKLWPMPEVRTIVKTGTSDSLVIGLQQNY